MFQDRASEELFERELRPIVQREIMSMPTTTLDGESHEDARRRRFQEEAEIEAAATAKAKQQDNGVLAALIESVDAAECAYESIYEALPDGPIPEWFIRLEAAAKQGRAAITKARS